MALVSVLLPYKDAAPTLAAAVDSVLAQRQVELELIAIDDGSRDDGPALIADRAARDDRVVALATGGLGIVGALEAGRAVARGPWIARMDGDDICHPDRLRRQLAQIAGDDRLGALGTQVAAVAVGDVEVGDGLRRYVAWQNALITPADHARELLVESPLCHPSVVLRRAALEQVGGWRRFDGPEDYDLWLRLAAAGWALAKVPEVLLQWRHLAGRLTFADPRYAATRMLAAKAPFIAAALRARARPFVVWGAGPTGKRLARALEAADLRPDAFIDIDPRKLERTARGAPIWPPARLPLGTHTVVVAVGTGGVRDQIRDHVVRLGGSDADLLLCS